MITVGIASIPSRSAMLEQVLDSLTGQVDQIFVGLNYCDEPAPMYLDKYSNVFWWTTHNHHGDAEKFAMVQANEDYYVSWDDDLIAYPWSIKKLVEGVDRYNGAVGYHGRFYEIPVIDFRKFKENYRCLTTILEDKPVNFLGTGCTAFHTDRLKLSMTDFKMKNMADIWFNMACENQGVPRHVLAHKRLTYLNPTETIWRSTKDFSEHTAILKSFIK